MSELNKKKNGILKFVIFYVVLIVIITAVLNFLYLKYDINVFKISKTEDINKVEVPKDVKEKIDYSNIKRSELTDKYYMNNIEIDEKTKGYGNIIDSIEYSNDTKEDVYKISIYYTQINGLKDADLQKKINKEIRETAENLVLDEEITDSKINRMIVRVESADIGSSNLLSVTVNKSIDYVDEKYDYKYYPSLNYKLDTGEKVEFEELFTEDANVKNIVSNTLYKNFAFDYGLDMDMGSGDLDEVDYGKIENDVYNSMNKFYSNEKVFWFSQEYITFVVDDTFASIKTADYSDYINMNNIVNPKTSLYVNGNKEKKNYVFGTPYMESLEYFGKVSNDTFLSVFNFYKINGELMENDYDNTYQEYTDNLVNNLDNIKNAIKSDTKKESGKGYVYNISAFHENYYDGNQNSIGMAFTGEKVEVDLDDFEENAETVYALSSRGLSGGEYYLSLTNLLNSRQYKMYDIQITDKDNDGEFEVGQKLWDIDDWESFYESEYEY